MLLLILLPAGPNPKKLYLTWTSHDTLPIISTWDTGMMAVHAAQDGEEMLNCSLHADANQPSEFSHKGWEFR